MHREAQAPGREPSGGLEWVETGDQRCSAVYSGGGGSGVTLNQATLVLTHQRGRVVMWRHYITRHAVSTQPDSWTPDVAYEAALIMMTVSG